MACPSLPDRNRLLAIAKATIEQLIAYRQIIIVIVTILLLSPLIIVFENDPMMKVPMRCAFILGCMIVFWLTECLPPPITGLVPMVLCPFLSVVKSSELIPQYMQANMMVYVGSIFVLTAFEKAYLHSRLAYLTVRFIGTKPRWLLLGFMLSSWALSIFLSNTMLVTMYVPIVITITAELRKAVENIRHSNTNSPVVEIGPQLPTASYRTDSNEDIIVFPFQDDSTTPMPSTISIEQEVANYEAMSLVAIAYSTSIGGFASVIGSGTNIASKELIDRVFDDYGCNNPLNFWGWIIYALLASLLLVLTAWVWLLAVFLGPLYAFGCRRTSPLDQYSDKIIKIINELYDALPKMKYHQWSVLGIFLAMCLAMMTRQLSQNPTIGWDLVAPGYVDESTAAVLFAIVVFIYPIAKAKRDEASGKLKEPRVALSWKEGEKAFPISVVLVLGGGLAIAYAVKVSGLAKLMAEFFTNATIHFSDEALTVLLIGFTSFLTEFMANQACATLMLPIVAQIAVERTADPLLFMLPTAIAAAFAFMFPFATTANAIVVTTGNVKIIELCKAGLLVKIVGIGAISLATFTWGWAYFDLDTKPWVIIEVVNATGQRNVTCLY